ncbi:MAG: OadG family transporter subunit [Bacteroidota bacterium]
MNEALTLLGSGMLTIFVILSLVVLMGNLLIRLVNRWTPESLQTEKAGGPASGIEAETIAAIVAAVERTTQGKGRVVAIEPSSSSLNS